MAKSLNVIINFESEKEFDDFICGLNNAYIAYHDIVAAIRLCCEVPKKWSKFSYKDEDKLIAREQALVKVCKQLEEIEKNGKIL